MYLRNHMVFSPEHNCHNSVPQSSHIEKVRDFLTSDLDQQIDPQKNFRQRWITRKRHTDLLDLPGSQTCWWICLKLLFRLNTLARKSEIELF